MTFHKLLRYFSVLLTAAGCIQLLMGLGPAIAIMKHAGLFQFIGALIAGLTTAAVGAAFSFLLAITFWHMPQLLKIVNKAAAD